MSGEARRSGVIALLLGAAALPAPSPAEPPSPMDTALPQQHFERARTHFVHAIGAAAGRAGRLVEPTVAPEADPLGVDGLYPFELPRRGKRALRGFAAADGRVVLGHRAADLPVLLRACALLTDTPRVNAHGLAQRLVWLQPEQGSLLTGAPDPFVDEPSEDLAPRFEPQPDGGIALVYTTFVTGRTGSRRRVPHALRVGPGYVVR